MSERGVGPQGSTCEKPRCSRAGKKTYNGKNGNTLRLCEEHYYDLVSGSDSLSLGGSDKIGTSHPLMSGSDYND